MSFCKKIILFFSVLFISIQMYALPGVQQTIPDISGEYVFYRDNTFQRESYIGILFYNESTYALRYFAPYNIEENLLQKDITIYLTINPDSDFMEFTGEKIIGETEASDADIINYLHGIMYDFTNLRQNSEISDSIFKTTTQKTEIAQFGGSVTLFWDNKIPVFNLKEIRAVDGTQTFVVSTVGRLSDSADESFNNFRGIENQVADKERVFAKAKKSKAKKCTFDAQTVTLDSQWEQAMENLWLLGDFASVVMSSRASVSPENLNVLVRSICEGANGFYSLWNHLSVNQKGNQISVNTVLYQPDFVDERNSEVQRRFVFITTNAQGGVDYFVLTVFDSVYRANKAYFDKILKSYKVK